MMLNSNLVRTLRSVIRHNAARPALLDGERVFTWAEFGQRIGRVAGALRSMGVAPGTRFAVLSRNGFRMEEIKWAGLWLGAVPVPVNWRLAAPEIAHILQDADCRCVLSESEFSRQFVQPALAGWTGRLVTFGCAAGPDAAEYENRLAQSETVDPFDAGPDDDALLLYTGGTTGRSKGVRLTHANLLANTLQVGLAAGARRQQVYLNAAPMFHAGGLLSAPWLLQGAAQCYLPAFSPRAFLESIERHRVGAVVAVPAMLIETVRYAAFSNFDLSSLRVLIYGSSPMALEWIERVAAALPHVDMFNAYGQTEAAPILSILDAGEFRAALGRGRRTGEREGRVLSAGKPNVMNELRILREDGREAQAGESGEIAARGPTIMKGYLNRPEETCAVLRDGWLHTGDIGQIDEDGYLYVLDRAKDMLISGGENIYSSEIEEALHRHPAVAEAAVIGVPDERLGETVMAVVVKAGAVTPGEDELMRHCREWLGGFKVPRKFAFVEALPKSAMGKVLKAALRRQFADSARAPAADETRRRPKEQQKIPSPNALM